MHPSARAFVQDTLRLYPGPYEFVLEVGSRDINGGIRDLFEPCVYFGIDLEPGPGVDEVADVTAWQTDRRFDAVVCCEVLEHAPDPQAVVAACIALLNPHGRLILTAASNPRAPHSGHDGAAVQTGEHYANVDPDTLRSWLTFDGVQVQSWPWGDVYATGVR